MTFLPKLETLAKRHGTDKFWHGYCPLYDEHFTPMRQAATKVLEIGIMDGASMRMWLDYFPKAEVFGLDNGLYGTLGKWPSGPRSHPYKGDQGERPQLEAFLNDAGGGFALILDDGSHTMHDQQVSLAVLFRAVKPGGFYVIEDLHTSLMPSCCVTYGNGMEYRYPTGADIEPTTLAIVLALKAGEHVLPPYITENEWAGIVDNVAEVLVYDETHDGMVGFPRHITAIIRKKEVPCQTENPQAPTEPEPQSTSRPSGQ